MRGCRGTNPTDSSGRITSCAVCASRFHWAKDCPDGDTDQPLAKLSIQNDEDGEKVYLTFAMQCTKLLTECKTSGILDTACTATVAGDAGFKAYVNLLPSGLLPLSHEKSTAAIVFGDNKRVEATYKVLLPVKFGAVTCRLNCEIIPGDLPLLISIKSMKKAGMVIHTKQKFVTLEGLDAHIDLRECSTGPMLIEILPTGYTDHTAFIATGDITRAQIEKLHCQFGHCSSSKLQQLLKNAGINDKSTLDAIDEVVRKCDICIRFGKARPKPVASLPMATSFNEVLAMDLHELTTLGRDVYYLHVIDMFSRYSAATLIYDKKPETIINGVLEIWGSVYGMPQKVLTDNGGEFDNDKFRSMCENYDVEIIATPGESPWSNGICERHNSVLTETFLKSRECSSNADFNDKIIMKYSAHAKNCLFNKNGFTPYQIVFGSNPTIPNVVTNKPPAL